ncbi:integral membrane protein PTH11 [Fusarium pseudocircinatum]|uniref:Integral membrane protein PTH11 n=1 Tax=Fusarium pseudocircinatum TaxID=56676 RepID=A0A8H5PEL0_9HYPO|nr:integral membrane protein PTH11 [Fusarium pseudocircinatum]
MTAAPTVEPRGLGLAQLITSIIFGILTTVVVFLRTYIRVRNRVFGADDLLMAIGYILFAILVGVTAQSTFYGVGQRDAVLPEGIYPHGKFMKLATKISISLVLGLGALASVATMIRMPFVLFYFHPNPNYLYRHCHVSLWSVVEAGIGIIAGSLPALRKFVKRWITFDSSARQYSSPKQYGGSHGLGITSHIGTSSRVKGYNISREVENDGKDHWEGLDDGSSRRGIIVTVDVEMHTLGNNAGSIGSRVSDETYARPAYTIYFDQTNNRLLQDGSPIVVMTCGIAGAGKSTLAKAIVAQLPNFKRLSNDQIIYESHGLYKIDYHADQYEVYQQEASQKLIAELERILQNKANDVVLDLSFYDKEYRDEYKDIVERNGGHWVLVYLDAGRDLLWNRIQRRRAERDSLDAKDPERNGDSAFDIDDETFAMYLDGFEPPSGEGEIVIKVE